MTDQQQEIINMISAEIAQALDSSEHYRCEEAGDIDKIEANIKSYSMRATKLKSIRESLENEFTVIHYDPR